MCFEHCRICKQITTLHRGACKDCIDRGLLLVEREDRNFAEMDAHCDREQREYALAHGFDPFGEYTYDEWWKARPAKCLVCEGLYRPDPSRSYVMCCPLCVAEAQRKRDNMTPEQENDYRAELAHDDADAEHGYAAACGQQTADGPLPASCPF